jgi:CRISPR/Cas system-associated endoribonuclease Cas2
MAYFVATYDLVKDKDYSRIIAEIERLKGAKLALSVWLLDLSNDDAGEVKDHLSNFIDEDDKLIVIEFTKKPRYTRAFTTGTAWIEARF